MWWETPGDKLGSEPEELVGLALSGGGIRSATLSLGVIEALAKAKRDALANIDILSSVSGGGYVGCFLRSLFVPDEARGILPKIGRDLPDDRDIPLDPGAVADQYRFARRVLESGTNERDIQWAAPGEKAIVRRNPLWWLREHSRYLAPNGPTDYSYAFAYIARNWLAMLYIFLVASLAIASTFVLIEALLASKGWLTVRWTWIPVTQPALHALPCGRCAAQGARYLPISPVIALAVLPLIVSAVLSVAYWMTERMSPNEPDFRRQLRNLALATAGTLIGAGAIIWLSSGITPGALEFTAQSLELQPSATLFVWLVTVGLTIMVLSAGTALVLAAFLAVRGVALTSELRRHLTTYLASSNSFLFLIVSVSLIDSVGAGLAHWLRNPALTIGAISGALLPVLAYIIKKLPDWFGGTGKASFFTLLGRFANTVALIAGVLLFGSVAVFADALVHLAAWKDIAWHIPTNWPHLLLLIGIIWVLAILSGFSDGFINLSSLHFLYASRLTRAYLGATNNERLEAAARYRTGGSIKESHKADYIQPEIYSRADLPAPIHIINTTINETIDPQSQLVARDRKGDVLSLEPSGIKVGNDPVAWNKVGRPKCAEQLSLGQWCAISGAAASSGMGRLTNLGFALAFTFANVRLGYWWWSPGVRREDRRESEVSRALSFVFGTFIYLFNEMTARYSRDYARKYLTDGGHFENTGAYRLIQHRVPLILLTDNGADPKYRFEDLENVVRKVRLDLGFDAELLAGAELKAFQKRYDTADPSIFVDPAEWTDWREAFASKESTAYVLVLRVRTGREELHIIWLKPRLLRNMPADVLGYSADNPDFPQQSTGDQFFDESQWESYRKLGELSMTRLLDACPRLLMS